MGKNLFLFALQLSYIQDKRINYSIILIYFSEMGKSLKVVMTIGETPPLQSLGGL